MENLKEVNRVLLIDRKYLKIKKQRQFCGGKIVKK